MHRACAAQALATAERAAVLDAPPGHPAQRPHGVYSGPKSSQRALNPDLRINEWAPVGVQGSRAMPTSQTDDASCTLSDSSRKHANPNPS